MHRLLIINPGSTSTKIAVYEDEMEVFVESISHSIEELKVFPKIIDQFAFRKDTVIEALKCKGYSSKDFDAIVARGGILPPIKTGAYLVNADMIFQLKEKPVLEHASNLAALIADEVGREAGIPSYIYDGVSADEMLPILKVTGLPELKRKGQGHNLNLRAAGMRYAKEAKMPFSECKLIVAHLGGGISICVQDEGKIIDIVNDEDGPFTPERAGALPMLQLMDMFIEENCDRKSLKKRIKTQAGFVAYFNTNDSRKVEELAANGDEEARFIYHSMAINVAKCICKEAAVLKGKIDAVILTGGIAYSELFTGMIKEYVSFLAPVLVYAGENEMQSLALGGLRVLRHEEEYNEFVKQL